MRDLFFDDVTTTVLALMCQLGYQPEKAQHINAASPVEDFFNLVMRKRDGSRVGVVGIKPTGKPLQHMEIVLTPTITHRDLYWCLLSGMLVIMAFELGIIHESPKVNVAPKIVYSQYDNDIQHLRFLSRIVSRRMRRAQRKLLGVEADRYNAVFRAMFRLHQRLVRQIEEIIHKNEHARQLFAAADPTHKH